jgi:hypothetical protein
MVAKSISSRSIIDKRKLGSEAKGENPQRKGWGYSSK